MAAISQFTRILSLLNPVSPNAIWLLLISTALVINLEPSRIALILYILTLRRPRRLLLFFLGTGLVINFTVGLCSFLLLPILQSFPQFHGHTSLQALLGSLLVLFGLFLLISSFSRSSAVVSEPSLQEASRLPGLLRGSSLFAMVLLALPSLDFLLLMSLVHTSIPSVSQRILALTVFLLVANLVFLVPLVILHFFQDRLDRLMRWKQLIPASFGKRLSGTLMILVGTLFLFNVVKF